MCNNHYLPIEPFVKMKCVLQDTQWKNNSPVECVTEYSNTDQVHDHCNYGSVWSTYDAPWTTPSFVRSIGTICWLISGTHIVLYILHFFCFIAANPYCTSSYVILIYLISIVYQGRIFGLTNIFIHIFASFTNLIVLWFYCQRNSENMLKL